MQNNGAATWSTANNYRLGSQNPQDNGTWGLGRVDLPASVAPGGQVPFNFNVTAPSNPGTYNFQWRMVHDGVAWFGDYSPNVVVTVSSASTPAPTATPRATPPDPCRPRCNIAPAAVTVNGGDPNPTQVSLSSDIAGATIFYTQNSSSYQTPTHDGLVPTGSTMLYTGPISVAPGTVGYFGSVVYMPEVGQSEVITFFVDNTTALAAAATGPTASPTPRNVTYALDLVGNRTNVNVNGVNTGYSPDNINRYTQVGGNTVTPGPEHQIGAYQGFSYQYVGDSYVASITGAGVNYVVGYDALGRCVKRTMNGTTTYYLYDGEKPIMEYKADSSIAAKNVYGRGIDEILMRSDYVVNTSGQTYFYQHDHEGSVTHLTNASGQVIESYRYDAFGAPTTTYSAGNFNNRFKFTGREYIQQVGVYEYRARVYHPVLGRFISEDPKGFDAGDYNLFRYCHNDPEDLTDAMGFEPEKPGYDPQNPAAPYHKEENRMVTGSNIPIHVSITGTIDSKGNFHPSSASAGGMNFTFGQIGRTSDASPQKQTSAPVMPNDIRTNGMKATKNAVALHSGNDYYEVGHRPDGTFAPSKPSTAVGGLTYHEFLPGKPKEFDVIGHQHPPGSTSFRQRSGENDVVV